MQLPTDRILIATPEVKQRLALIATGKEHPLELFVGLTEHLPEAEPPSSMDLATNPELPHDDGNAAMSDSNKDVEETASNREAVESAAKKLIASNEALIALLRENVGNKTLVARAEQLALRIWSAADGGPGCVESFIARVMSTSTYRRAGSSIHVQSTNIPRRSFRLTGSSAAQQRGRPSNEACKRLQPGRKSGPRCAWRKSLRRH